MWLLRISSILLLSLSISQCGSIQNTELGNIKLPLINNKPKVSIAENFNKVPLKCIAILPVEISSSANINISDEIDTQKLLRNTIYAHTAPYQYQDVELAKVDYFFKDKNLDILAKETNCNNFISGKILAFTQSDYKIYSNIVISLELELININLDEPLWNSQHTVNTHGGNIPLSPIGLAFGLADAAKNLEDQQYVRIVDEVVRAMILTLPDSDKNITAVGWLELDEVDNNIYKNVSADTGVVPQDFNETKFRAILVSENYSKDIKSYAYNKLIEQHPTDIVLLNQFNEHLYANKSYTEAYQNTAAMIINGTTNASTYLMRGQLSLKLNNLKEAENSFIKASALNNDNATALNALAYVYMQQENLAKTEAAYLMALKVEPLNAYTNLNLASILSNSNRITESVNYYQIAAKSYYLQGKIHKFIHIRNKIQLLQKQGHEVRLAIEYLNNFDLNNQE